MKVRTDFVSNSSSSSFIVSAEDNKYFTILPKPKILTFKEYFDRYSGAELGLDYYWYDVKIQYVEDDKFIKMFLESIYRVIPLSLKPLMEEQLELGKNIKAFTHKVKDWENPILAQMYDEEHELSKAISDGAYKLLEPKYKNMYFCYQEVEDNYLSAYDEEEYEDEQIHDGMMSDDNVKEAAIKKEQNLRSAKLMLGEYDIQTDEDLYKHRIDYMNSIKPLKFYRIFSNH